MDPQLPPAPVAALASQVGAATRDVGDVVVTDVTYDARRVTPGSLFFCVPGAHADGHAFADEAVAAGAAALVVERWLPIAAPQVLVGSTRRAMGPMSAAAFGHPARDMTMLGVTGTNGKTTTTFLLEAILRSAGRRPALVGTTGVQVDGRLLPIELTTPEAPDLHRLLARLRASGVDAVAMEVSSHALAYDRVGGIVFDVAAFTNLSHDHLDLHGTMEAYLETKTRLFTEGRARHGAVNLDDPAGPRIVEATSVPIRTFGLETSADRRATEVVVTPDGSTFVVEGHAVTTRLVGRFNVSNALCAITVAELTGIPVAEAAGGVASAGPVPGRLERIDEGQGFLVMVDYAHTPDSIQHVLRGARPLAAGRLIVVFGCGGDRDQAKRPQMGRVATDGADLTVITTDNPRSEEPEAIIDAIVEGARGGAGRWVIEPDRRAAIGLAVGEARDGDVVIIAGKGHEPRQELAGRSVPFDDRSVAREALRAMGARS